MFLRITFTHFPGLSALDPDSGSPRMRPQKFILFEVPRKSPCPNGRCGHAVTGLRPFPATRPSHLLFPLLGFYPTHCSLQVQVLPTPEALVLMLSPHKDFPWAPYLLEIVSPQVYVGPLAGFISWAALIIICTYFIKEFTCAPYLPPKVARNMEQGKDCLAISLSCWARWCSTSVHRTNKWTNRRCHTPIKASLLGQKHSVGAPLRITPFSQTACEETFFFYLSNFNE